MYFRFQDPLYGLLLLLLVAALGLRRYWGKGSTLRFSSNWALHEVVKRGFSRLRRLLTVLRLLVLLLIVIALMRPQIGRKWIEEVTAGVDIMLAIDLSGSMHAHDFELDGKLVNRLVIVKEVVAEFIQNRKHDRIGLLVFAEEPFLVSPLTSNREWLQSNFERLEIGLIGPNSTAIGSAIGMATNRLRSIEAESKVLILLTDGENNAGNLHPITAAEAADRFGIRIYTIGVGKSGAVLMPRQGTGGIVRNPSGNPVMDWVEFEIDEPMLREIAQLTGGTYFRATSSESLKTIYQEIDRLEKREVTFVRYDEARELMMLPMMLAAILLALELFLARTFLHKVP